MRGEQNFPTLMAKVVDLELPLLLTSDGESELNSK